MCVWSSRAHHCLWNDMWDRQYLVVDFMPASYFLADRNGSYFLLQGLKLPDPHFISWWQGKYCLGYSFWTYTHWSNGNLFHIACTCMDLFFPGLYLGKPSPLETTFSHFCYKWPSFPPLKHQEFWDIRLLVAWSQYLWKWRYFLSTEALDILILETSSYSLTFYISMVPIRTNIGCILYRLIHTLCLHL